MSDSRRYESDPQRDVPVTTSTHAGVRVTYATARSYRSLIAGQTAQNYLAWRANAQKVVFAVCDGHDSPFAGQLAARFLGERLLEWLWALPDEVDTPQDELKVRLAYQLNAWAQMAQEHVLAYPLADGLGETQREELENLRRSQGSEAFFACGRLDYSETGQAQVLFAWAGEAFLRCISTDGGLVQFDPVRNPANRWSSIFGLRGSLSVAHLGDVFAVQRVLAYSPALGSLESDLSGLSPRAVQSLIQECFLNRSAGDTVFLDLQIRPQGPEEDAQVEDVTGFREELSEILMKYQLTRGQTGFFEWSFPVGAVYAVLEERSPDGVQRVVYAGPATHWVAPDDSTGCRYRVCVYSPDGKSWSGWVDAALAEDAGMAETPVKPEVQPGERPVEIGPVLPSPAEAVRPALLADKEPLLSEAGDLLTWTKETPEPALPEAETRSSQALDWENWQPKYYGEPAGLPAPAAPVEEPPPAPEAAGLSAPVEASLPLVEVEPVQPAVELETRAEPESETAKAQQPAPDVEVLAADEKPSAPEDRSPPTDGSTGWMNFRSRKGEQSGEYILEWNPVSQVRDYEIKAHFGNKDRQHTVSGTRDTVRGLEPGRHYFRIRPIYPGPRPEWDEHNLTVIDVPEKIQKAPGNLSLEINPDHTFTLHWVFPAGEIVEEFLVYDLTGRKPELLLRLPPETSRCLVTPPGLEDRRKYGVRAANWSGPGPESSAVVYDPPGVQPQPGALQRLLGLLRVPSAPSAAKEEKPEKDDTITCTTFYELCEEVTRYVKRNGIRMERIRLEQRLGSEENYIPVDSRRTTELVSLNFTKGPDHRLFVFGTRGEVVTATITFDKTRWTMKVRFSLAQKA